MLKELLELIARISQENYKPAKLELDGLYVLLSEKIKDIKYGQAKGMQQKLDELFSKGNQEDIKVFLIVLINIIVELTIVIVDIDIDVDIDTEIDTEIVVKKEAEINADVDVETKIDAELEIKTEVKDNKAIVVEDIEIKGNRVISIEDNEIYIDKSKENNIVFNFFNFGNIG